jgi:hypothetical protein
MSDGNSRNQLEIADAAAVHTAAGVPERHRAGEY